MKFKLVIVAGEGLRNEVELTPPVVIGRSRSADVTIGHPLVSRRHCEITEGDDQLLIVEDLGSLNGTFVGEVRIEEPVYLEPGDYLTVGSVTFQALYGAHTQPDFLAEDSNAQATEEMPDFTAAEPDAAESLMFEPADEDAAPDADAEQVEEIDIVKVIDPGDEVEIVQTLKEVEPAEPVEEAADPEVIEDPAASKTVSHSNESGDSSGSGLGWLVGKPGDEDSAKKRAGDDDLDDFFKNL